ncbi:hypothetical protein MMC22_005380 [Lobaria immixta]|nr:hypothetical protein [Lobaria immixta]
MKQRTWSQELVTPHSRTTPYPADALPCEPGTEEHARSRDLQSQDAEGLRKSSEDALGKKIGGKTWRKRSGPAIAASPTVVQNIPPLDRKRAANSCQHSQEQKGSLCTPIPQPRREGSADFPPPTARPGP